MAFIQPRLKTHCFGYGSPSGKLQGQYLLIRRCMARVLKVDVEAPNTLVVVGPEGEIVVEWQQDDNYIELEVSKPYVGEWMFENSGMAPKHYVMTWRGALVAQSPVRRQPRQAYS